MDLKRSFLSLCLAGVVATGSTGCSSSYTTPVAVGGLGGAAAGAGTGAIIGAVIANGDVAASALMGGAIGLPVGLALGAIYHYNSAPKVAERKGDLIRRNQEEIFARQREIDALREDLRNESYQGNPPETQRQYHYNGNTLGNYYR
jgi:hypothetical protein